MSTRLCMLCADAVDAASCSRHPDEPLLDLSDREVLGMLDAEDDKQRQRVYGFWMTLGGFLGLVVGVPLLAGFMLFSPIWSNKMWLIALLPGSAGAALGSKIAATRVRPKFRKWLVAAGFPGYRAAA